MDVKRWEILFVVLLVLLVLAISLLVIWKIRVREDLALLEIDLTETVLNAKKCLEGGGVVQDPSLGEEGKVFICSRQDIVRKVYPVLKQLSYHHYNYQYLPLGNCLQKTFKCQGKKKKKNVINIGLKNNLVISCDVEKGFCKIR